MRHYGFCGMVFAGGWLGVVLLLFAVLLSVGNCTFLVAQTASTGALLGTVTDASGAAMVGVNVTVVNRASGTTRTTTTDSTGLYRVPLLPPGTYSVEFAAEGFKTQTRTDIAIQVTEPQTLNIVMQVGARTESVTVEGGTHMIQAETATLGGLVGELTVKSLPLATRNYTQILHMSPGVMADLTNAGQLGRNTQDVYVNGSGHIDNNFQMDGAQINNFGTGRAGDWLGYTGISIPNPDAIQEFKVQTTLYDAGYGRGVGANVNVVTKSGSNEFHGNIFEFLRNEALNANDFFLNRNGQPKPILRQNQFGGTVGGPIRKDKFFFFTSYQGTRQTNGVGSSSLQSAFLPPLTNDRSAATLGSQFCGQSGANGGVAVACDGSNINPVALALLNFKLPNGQFLIPVPQVIQPNGVGLSVFSIPSKFVEDQFLINLDFILSKNNTLSGRWFYSRDPQVVSFTDSNLPGSGAKADFQNRNLVVKLVSILTPSFMNEARFSFKRNFGDLHTQTPVKVTDIGMTPSAELPTIPIIQVSGLFHIGGNWNDDFKTAVTSFTWGDQISWVHGRHNIRTGFEIERISDNFDLFGPKRGSLFFLSFPDFLLGMNAAQNGTPLSNIFGAFGFGGLTDRQLRLTDWSTFIQDDFKVHPQLTINLGVRWEVNGGVTEKQGRMVNFWPSLAENVFPPGGTLTGFVAAKNFPGSLPPGVVRNGNNTCCASAAPLHNWGPRVGLAWRPFARTNRLVIRSGYGIFYSRASGNEILQLITLPPFNVVFQNFGVDNALSTFQVPFNPGPPPPSAFPIWLPRTPTSQLAPEFIAENWDSPITQKYTLNIQYEFLPNFLLDVGYVGTHGTRLLGLRAINQARLASPQNPINGITTNTVANARDRVPILGFSPGLFFVESYGSVIHNALQASVSKRLTRGLQFQTSYTWGKTLNDIPQASQFLAVSGGFFTNDANNRRQAWGPADFDRRHRLVFSFSWELPNFRKGTGFGGKLLSGWDLSGVTTFQSGKALILLDQRAGSIYGGLDPLFHQLRAQLCPGFTHQDIPTSGPVDSRLGNYFNRAVFCPPRMIGDGTDFGDLGRGVVRGPDQRNFDLAITKRTTVGGWTEGANIEFRAEFYNFFNTPQFADPAHILPFASFGTITRTAVASRIIQFGLKYNF